MGDFYDLFVEYAPLFLEASWITLRLTAAALLMAMVLGGLRHPSQGFVAVGFSAAFDENSNGKLDPPTDGGEGDIPIRLGSAPRGLERSPVHFSALFVEKNKLSGERGSHSLAYSGLVSSPSLRRLKDDDASTVTLPNALAFPQQVSLDVASARFEHSGLDAATMMRLDLGADWSVYFPATRKVVDLTGLALDEHMTATLHALRLGRKIGVDYQAALRFDGDDLDDLNGVMDAFSVRPLTASEVRH